MKDKILMGLLVLVWLVFIADIIWEGTEGKWIIQETEKVGELEVAQYTNQVIIVAVSDECTSLCMYEREMESWQLVFETEAIIGKNGLKKTKEGDGKTPVGVFCFVKAFGILENPGANMDYTKVDETHYWVDDSNSKYYNQFIAIDEVEADWKTAEHLLEYGESYHYVLATSFNAERIQGAGSAVFLHCMSQDADATAGCIAIPEVYMRELIKRVESQCVLIIDEAERILLY